MSAELIVSILSAGGFSAILAAFVTGLFSKRKLSADAAEIITKAAAGVVTNMQSEIDRQVILRQEQALDFRQTMDSLLADHKTEMAEVHRVLQLHIIWDTIAIAKVNELGHQLPDPPPLFDISNHGGH